MFSSRVPAQLGPNRLTVAIRQARAARRTLIDLTLTNPTAAGIAYPSDVLEPLGDPAGRTYEPHPFGLPAARSAVSADYARRGMTVGPDRIALTASTSEAYSLLFKLLCEPAGSRVLVPVPSYPLFDHLTRLDGVTAVPYRLEYHGRWCVEWDSLDSAWTGDVRAVLAVSPNNPTGSSLTRQELRQLADRCATRGAALIVDEVFSDYVIDGRDVRSGRPDRGRADGASTNENAASSLIFRLGGLSKSAGLPQVKLGWIAVEGPERLVDAALERLELVCDTYLSVSTPVQVAAPTLLARGAPIRDQILARVQDNYAVLRERARARPSIDVLHLDGGWSAVVRVPSTRSEEDLVLDLLEHDGVLVHPGFFFDFAHEAFVVVSLLPELASFREGVDRMLERADV
jgi:aspartate/methionine/tyrosine aminotransferase